MSRERIKGGIRRERGRTHYTVGGLGVMQEREFIGER